METTDIANIVCSSDATGKTSPNLYGLENADLTGNFNGIQHSLDRTVPNFTEQYQYLLNQIEHGLYETSSKGNPSYSNGSYMNGALKPRIEGAGKYEFGVEMANVVSSSNANTSHMLTTNVKKLRSHHRATFNTILTPLELPTAFASLEQPVYSYNHPYNQPANAFIEMVPSQALSALHIKKRRSLSEGDVPHKRKRSNGDHIFPSNGSCSKHSQPARRISLRGPITCASFGQLSPANLNSHPLRPI
jgi:hypothetical protein